MQHEWWLMQYNGFFKPLGLGHHESTEFKMPTVVLARVEKILTSVRS